MSTGDRTILGRITKRGNCYLRMLFVQGPRAILLRPTSWAKHSFGPWLKAAARRLHRNVSGNRARQQAGTDRFDCLGSRTQLRNTHRTRSGVIEQNELYRGRRKWIANVEDQQPVLPAEVCELDGGDGETV